MRKVPKSGRNSPTLLKISSQPYITFEGGVEKDSDIAAALLWLASVSGNVSAFFARLLAAQHKYREVTGNFAFLGKDPSWSDLGPDIVAAYLAQGKSLLDDRRSYDLALASNVAPWLKQLGANLSALTQVEGASARVLRMLGQSKVLPNSALFELVIASNYAAEGFDVAFIEEGPAKTPDLRLSSGELNDGLFVDLKLLQRGEYQSGEQRRHSEIFNHLEPFLHEQRLSVDIDVTYGKELCDVPVEYLLLQVKRAMARSSHIPGSYAWQDEFGSGLIRSADLEAVRRDTCNNYLYFGTKMARLLSGRVVSESNYHLAAEASANPADPRYIDQISFGSIVTWQCLAPKAIERKAKYVLSKIAEADKQIAGYGRGIIHVAMDAELHSDASDLRRERNQNSVEKFQMESQTVIVYLHYFVSRVSENHSWLIDETVDVFSRLEIPPPPFPAFPNATELDNDEPAWRQRFGPSPT